MMYSFSHQPSHPRVEEDSGVRMTIYVHDSCFVLRGSGGVFEGHSWKP